MPEQLKDIRFPINIPLPLTYWVGLVLVMALLILWVWAVRWWWIHRTVKAVGSLPVKVMTRSPGEIAREALDRLNPMDPQTPEAIKQFYLELSTIIRRYLEAQYQTPVMEWTTTEIRQFMKQHHWAQQESIDTFLGNTDIVKFAKHLPGKNEIKVILYLARGIVI